MNTCYFIVAASNARSLESMKKAIAAFCRSVILRFRFTIFHPCARMGSYNRRKRRSEER